MCVFYCFAIFILAKVQFYPALSSVRSLKRKPIHWTTSYIGNRSIGPHFQFFDPITSKNHDFSYFFSKSRRHGNNDLDSMISRPGAPILLPLDASFPLPPSQVTILRWPSRQFSFRQFSILTGFYATMN